MTLTLLLDLDGTLLDTEIDEFVAAYSQSLARHMSPFVEPGRLVKTLLAATQHMLRVQQPGAKLKDSFDAAFFPAVGLDQKKASEPIDAFYREVFPTLQPLTQRRIEAAPLIEEAFRRGYRVGIATNPMFPYTAITQLLTWAGLPPEEFPFAIIPSYETFHFAKPNPAFFAELLALLGWPEGPVVMVGNDLDADIGSACLMGIKSFLINSQPDIRLTGAYAPSAGGSLADLMPWLASIPLDALQADYSMPSALVATLQATAAALPVLAERLPTERWAQRPQPGEWSLTEILCHMRDVESEVNLDRFSRIAREANPFLPGMDTDPWAESRRYHQQDGRQALHDFVESRLELLALLDKLSPDDWQRPARHAIFGPTNFRELASITAGHDRLHIQQVHQLLSRRSI